MLYTKLTYQDIADELNYDFRTVLHATATDFGVLIVPICRLNMYRLAANIEVSRVITSRPNLTITNTDSGIICIR